MSELRIDASSVNNRMRVTCERCLRRYDVPDATVKGRKIRARCKCGARVVVQDEERAAKSVAPDSNTTGAIQRPVRWFVDITSWEPIAMDLRQLVRAFDAGRIDADTLVWRKGMPDWRRLRDVAELAERLIGADANQGSAAATEPPTVLRPGGSEPPPQQQSERSRTPPATYTVGAKRHSEAQPGPTAMGTGDSERPTVPPPEDGVGSLSGVSKAPGGKNGTAGAASPLPTPASPKARKSSRMGAPVSRAPFSPKPSRTITQTGLSLPPLPPGALPPKAGARSGAVGASSASALDSDAEKSARASAPGVAPSSARGARSATPAAGQRRLPSNDETPAQKPSSMSVPPDAISRASTGPRGKRLVAIAAVVFGVALGMQQWLADAPADGTAASAAAAETPADSPQIEKRNAPEPEPIRAPTPRSPETSLPSTAEASVTSPPEVGLAGGQPVPKPAPRLSPKLAGAQQPRVIAPRPMVRSPVKPAAPKGESPPSNAAPQAEDDFGIGAGSVEPTQASAAEVVQPPPSNISAPAVAGGTAELVPAGASEPPPAQPSAGSVAGSSPVTPSVPRAFDARAAEQHLGIAAWKASTCGELGPTRGSGQVKVLIETWGRVVRVTHQNQVFVGTPVGLCVMQAFQQVQVPPFDGTAQSVTGSFAIQ